MNAPSKLHRQLAASLALDIEPAARLITCLREVHNTGDDVQEENAVLAATEGRPAFWTTVASPYNQVANLFLALANSSGLDAAVEYCRVTAGSYGREPHQYQRSVLYNLSALIPLNEAAVKQLTRLKAEEWRRTQLVEVAA